MNSSLRIQTSSKQNYQMNSHRTPIKCNYYVPTATYSPLLPIYNQSQNININATSCKKHNFQSQNYQALSKQQQSQFVQQQLQQQQQKFVNFNQKQMMTSSAQRLSSVEKSTLQISNIWSNSKNYQSNATTSSQIFYTPEKPKKTSTIPSIQLSLSYPKKMLTQANSNQNFPNPTQPQPIQNKTGNFLNNPKFNTLLKQLNLDFDPNIPEGKKKMHLELTKLGLLHIYKYQSDNMRQMQELELENIAGKKKTLILDLDDTLIYTSQRGDEKDYQYCYKDRRLRILYNIRPFAKEFLLQMSKFYEIIIFTTGEYRYASTMCKILDPDQKCISYILDEKYPIRQKDGFLLKDLEFLKNRDLKDTIIVDNYIQSFAFQIDNGIPILMWKDDQGDQELKYLAEFLEGIVEEEDLRVPVQKRLRTKEIVEVMKSCREIE